MHKVIKHPILAQHSSNAITVYQAFSPEIGHAATKAGTLDVPAFSKTRMTWIKPSFLWVAYRCGWGRKDPGQKVILKIGLSRNGFIEILKNSCLSSFDAKSYSDNDTWKADLAENPNRIQWDPDKDLHLQPLDRRAIQIGIAPSFVATYLSAIHSIRDVTEFAQNIEALVEKGDKDAAKSNLPVETEVSRPWLKMADDAPQSHDENASDDYDE